MSDQKHRKGLPSPGDTEFFFAHGPGKRFTEPRLLCLLKRGPAHGYELLQRMADLPLPGPPPDTGATYRALREMEGNGLASSRWEEGGTGPRRRIYALTEEGERRLDQWVDAMQRRIDLLQEFVNLCHEKGHAHKAKHSRTSGATRRK